MVLVCITGELGCHSEDTLVWTPDGFKSFQDVNVGDFVWGCDSSFNLQSVKVLSKYEYDYDGEMVLVRNFHNLNLLVTPNHKVLIRRWWRNNFEYFDAKDLVRSTSYFPVKFNWTGKDEEFVGIGGFKFRTSDFMSLLGWYLSEGSIFRGKVNYFQIRNSSHITKIRELLDRMGLKYGFYEDSKFVVFERGIAKFFEENCGEYSYLKRIPKEFLEFSPYYLGYLYESMMDGDGTRGDTFRRYYTTSESLVVGFIELCFKLGYNANFVCRGIRQGGGLIRGRPVIPQRPSYEVGVQLCAGGYCCPYGRRGIRSKEPKNVSLVQYKGKVWCFTTESGNFFTLRNGKVCLSGNSGKTLSLTYLALRNYFNGVKIYANYHLNFPYTPVSSLEQIDEMRNGFFAGDELWLWIDSRASQSRKNKVISTILLKSRKRDINFSYTAQSFMQVDKRVRKVTDFIATPMLSPDERWCRLIFFSYPSYSKARTIKFKTAPIFELYDTREEISPLIDAEEDEKERQVAEKKEKKKRRESDMVEKLRKTIDRLRKELELERLRKSDTEI